MSKKAIIAALLLLFFTAGAVLLATKVTIHNRQGMEGIYLLDGENGQWLTITDDLYAAESARLLWGMPLPQVKKAQGSHACKQQSDQPCMEYEWNREAGRGYIKTIYPDGRKLIIGLGRFISSTGRPVSGLFLGGGLPVTDPDFQSGNNNETGMSYFDGNRYFHIWCNVNEGIEDSRGKAYLPSTWQYLSSKVLESSARQLTIVSKHAVVIDEVPLAIERYLQYHNGDTFVTLTTEVKNIGESPVSLMYIYADEPWIGNYYTFSKGNVGWHKDGLVYTESFLDTARYSYAGLFDYGNPLAGESHSYTGKANFIEWSPAERPDYAYFSNQFGVIAPPEKQVPLSSYKNRIISLQWGLRELTPDQALSFKLKVGMAATDPKTGMPAKPDTN